MKVFNDLRVSAKEIKFNQKLLKKNMYYSLTLQILIIFIITLAIFKMLNSQIWNTMLLFIALATMIFIWIVIIGKTLKIQQLLSNLDKMVFFAFVLPFIGIAILAVQAYYNYMNNPYDPNYYTNTFASSASDLERVQIILEDDLHHKKITKQQYNQKLKIIKQTIKKEQLWKK